MAKLFWLILSLACCQTATGQKSDFRTFISAEGQFSIKLPARPSYSTQKAGTDAAVGDSCTYVADQKDSAYYVSYTDFKPDHLKDIDPQKLLDGARDGGVSNSKGKLLNEKKVAVDGFPGREITIQLPGDSTSKARARFYLVKSRLYSMIFAGPKSEADSAATDVFLSSFKLSIPRALPDGWKTLESQEGRLSIKMPGKPVASVDGAGKKTAVHLWQVHADETMGEYFVAYNDIGAQPSNASVTEEALSRGMDAVTKSLSATVEQESLLCVDGNPGLERRLKLDVKGFPGGGYGVLRGFIVKDRYYQIMVLGGADILTKGLINDYMATFKLSAEPTVAR